MLRVRVFKKNANGVDEADLDDLLEAAGCVEVGDDDIPLDEEGIEQHEGELEQDEDEPERSVEEEADEAGEVTLIVVLTAECVDDPTLEQEVRRAVGGGGRAVGIWPKDTKEGELPAILDKVGSGAVVWDPKKLTDVLTDKETVWDTPAGQPRKNPPTKRNKC